MHHHGDPTFLTGTLAPPETHKETLYLSAIEFSIKFDTVKSGWSIVQKRITGYNFPQKYCISLKMDFVLATIPYCSISSWFSLIAKVPPPPLRDSGLKKVNII